MTITLISQISRWGSGIKHQELMGEKNGSVIQSWISNQVLKALLGLFMSTKVFHLQYDLLSG